MKWERKVKTNILSRRKRGEVIEEAIDYFVVKSVIFINNTAIFSI